jgi:hypothetical protein
VFSDVVFNCFDELYNDFLICCLLQKLASDFLSNYVFLAVGRVGSSTELIVQKVESVQDMEKRNRLVDLLQHNVVNGKVKILLLIVNAYTSDYCS